MEGRNWRRYIKQLRLLNYRAIVRVQSQALISHPAHIETTCSVSSYIFLAKLFFNLIQNHLLPAIGQLSGEDVPDQHGIGVHIHHHVVLGRRLPGLLRIQNIL